MPPPDFRPHAQALRALAATWTQSALFARVAPGAPALISARGVATHRQLHRRANQVARTLRAAGVSGGDAVTLMCSNRAEWIEVLLATQRIGARLTPISTQLTADEARYIVQDSQARCFIAEASLAGSAGEVPGVPRWLIGDARAAEASYADLTAAADGSDLPDPVAGTLMLYTSGTTGRPKGVYRGTPQITEPQFEGSFADYRPGDAQLCCGPAYHSAPLLFDIAWPLASGVPIVLMEKFDAATVLEAIGRHRITHLHLVPTMFARLHALPEEIKRRADVSSLRLVIHGAAPCPVALKRAMIEWFGPVLVEYYGATEGGHGINIASADWLRKPGAVGRLDPALGHLIADEQGQPVPPGTVGRLMLKAPDQGGFRYWGDPEKTETTYTGEAQTHFTLGDLGYVDDEGYLFLTGRAADCIISGGINIYPREIDEVLLTHPAVAQVCTIGAPDEEWGERVVAVVVPAADAQPGDALAQALIEHARARLASFKCPRRIVFETSLPHTATGKLLRKNVRERFWRDHQRSI